MYEFCWRHLTKIDASRNVKAWIFWYELMGVGIALHNLKKHLRRRNPHWMIRDSIRMMLKCVWWAFGFR